MFNLFKIIIVFATAAGFSVSALAQQQNDSNSKVKTKIEKKKSKTEQAKSNNPTLNSLNGGGSGWRLQGSVTHLPTDRKDQEDTTDILLRADYTINKKHRVRVQQYFNKVYGKYESENEFDPTDTQLVHFYRIGYKPAGIGLQWANSFALPISNPSNRDDLLTRWSSSLIASKGFFKNKLITFFVPYFRYHMYEYKTSVSGRPLPLTTFGASLAGLYFITPKLSFYGGLNYNMENTSESQFEPDPTYQYDEGIYRFDFDLSYQITNSLTTSLSYGQGGNYIQQGRYEFVLYDDQVSRVALGMTYIY